MTVTDTPATTTAGEELPRASVAESAAVVAEVLLPLVARGVIRRRPAVVRRLEAWDADRRAVERLRVLRERYGAGPLRLRLPGRDLAVVLDPDDVPHILAGDPEPFAPANLEKRAALSHFQPAGVLVSQGSERVTRRRFNEAALDSDRTWHADGERFVEVVREETDALLALTDRIGSLDWDDFLAAWYRIVRRVVLGDGARDDHRLTDELADLRDRANLSYLAPKDRRSREAFHRRLAAHLERAEAGSLAASVARTTRDASVDPVHQVPQWLFAFEPAGMATFRALALLAAQPGQVELHPGTDAPGAGGGLRGAVLESLRLWPTTPAILRDTTEPTTWRGRTLASGTGLLIFAPLFHRDEQRVDGADRFVPGRWDRSPVDPVDPPLVPFSGGPGVCPGRNVVLLVTTAMLERIVADRVPVRADDGASLTEGPLPSVLDPFTLEFLLPRRSPA